MRVLLTEALYRNLRHRFRRSWPRPAEGETQAMIQDMIFISCTLPASGTSGMTVYSVEAYNAAGKWITTELGTEVEAGKIVGGKCTAALNKLIGSTKGCPSGMTWMPVYQPYLNMTGSTGYAANLFSIMCMSTMGPMAPKG